MTPAERLAAPLVAENALDDAMVKPYKSSADDKKTEGAEGKGDGDA
ncbi:hypothetical protein [Streptosporangium saharense]